MISKNELKNVLVTVEQRFKELDQLRERDKHDSINLKMSCVINGLFANYDEKAEYDKAIKALRK